MEKKTGYIIRDGYNQMDFDSVSNLLKDAFWSKGIKKSEVIHGARNSALLVGVFTTDNRQVGYSRVISDKTRFAYILDVIVDREYQRHGIGQSMIRYILNHPDLKDVYQWLLLTKDAHGVYNKAGFSPVARPDDWLEIIHNRPDR